MKKFNHIKDIYFPDGYPEWIQTSIENTVQSFVDRILESFKKHEIKTILDIGSLNGIESVKFSEKFTSIRPESPRLQSWDEWA
jgi:hypothetical protein